MLWLTGLLLTVPWASCEIGQLLWNLWNLLGDHYLRYWREIFSSESFDEPFNGDNVFYLCLVNLTLLPKQLAGLGYGRGHICDIWNAYLISLNLSPGAHPGGEFCEYDCLLIGIDWVKVYIWYTFFWVIGPVTPIILPSPGSLRSESTRNWYPLKHNSTRDATFEGILYSYHDWFWGRGKLYLN